MIGRREYQHLKQLKDSLTETELIKVCEYEHANKPKQNNKSKEYFNRLNQAQNEEGFNVNYDVLLSKFKERFYDLERVDFDEKHLVNVKTILYYFSRDERFFKSDRLCKNDKGNYFSEPSFEKGLLIIGGYGNGKTSTMKTLKSLFDGTPLTFKSYTANRIVTTFESYSNGSERTEYMNRTKTKVAYFDDVKTEKDASNYGKHNLFKDILEERYTAKAKTYITCNFRETDTEGNIKDALHEFNEKYGPRVFDRLFEMFNIIEFKGASLRK
jgi:DNA replication protein DnaC